MQFPTTKSFSFNDIEERKQSNIDWKDWKLEGMLIILGTI